MWTFGGVRITVTDKGDEKEQIIAELQPLLADTVYQFFGNINPTVNVGCYVVSLADKNSIEAFAEDGTAYTLSGYGTDYGTFYLKKASFAQQHSYRQTFRSDKDQYDPVYKVTLTLRKT